MHPILFQLGPLTIGAYGVFVMISGIVAYLLLPRYARRYGVDAETARTFFVIVFVCGWLGSRVAIVMRWLPEIIEDPRMLHWFVGQAGLWYGSLAGGLLAGGVLAYRWKLSLWRLLDLAAVPASIGGGLGRIGCLMSGCCYGKPAEVPWAVTFTDPTAHRLHADLPWVPLHPTQLYELGAALLIAFIVDRFGARRHAPGQAGLLWLMLYGVARFIIEIFRGDVVRGTFLGVASTSQAIAVASVATATAIFVLRRWTLAASADGWKRIRSSGT